jgi:protein gp37
MALASRHQFQVLTKRPKRLTAILVDPAFVREVGEQATTIIGQTPPRLDRRVSPARLSNVASANWLIRNCGRRVSASSVNTSFAASER